MIEFLDSEPEERASDEDLAPPPHRDRLRGLWLPLLFVVLFVGALITVKVAPGHKPDPRPTDDAPTIVARRLQFLDVNDYPGSYVPYSSPSLAAEILPLRGIPNLPDPLTTGGRLPCPSRSACYLSRAMPPNVQSVLKAAFPLMEPARIITLNTEAVNQPLTVWFRQIYFVSDTLDVTIRVVLLNRGGLGFSDTIRYGTRTVNYTVVPNDGYAVIIHVESPTGADVRLSRLSLLAVDHTLYEPKV